MRILGFDNSTPVFEAIMNAQLAKPATPSPSVSAQTPRPGSLIPSTAPPQQKHKQAQPQTPATKSGRKYGLKDMVLAGSVILNLAFTAFIILMFILWSKTLAASSVNIKGTEPKATALFTPSNIAGDGLTKEEVAVLEKLEAQEAKELSKNSAVEDPDKKEITSNRFKLDLDDWILTVHGKATGDEKFSLYYTSLYPAREWKRWGDPLTSSNTSSGLWSPKLKILPGATIKIVDDINGKIICQKTRS
jgi:hypothetical protein